MLFAMRSHTQGGEKPLRCVRCFGAVAAIAIMVFSPQNTLADTAREHFNRGVTLYKDKRFDAAIGEFEAARKLAPDDDSIVNWIGWVYLSQLKFAEARAPLEKAIKLRPASADAHLNLGNVYDGLKMYPEAIKEFETVTKLKPQSADAYYNLGSVFFKLQRNQEAVASYRKATQFKPDDAYNWNGLGYVYQSTGRFSDAMTAYERAIKLSTNTPDNPTFQFNYAMAALGVAGKVRNLPGGTAKAKAESAYAHAIMALEEAAKAKPNDYQIRETYAETLFDVGRYADAIPEFEKASQLSPKQYDPYFNKGVAQERLGKFAAAAEAYKQAAEFAPPESHNALFRQGEMLFKQSLYDDAAKVFSQVTKAEPSNLNAWINLASTLREKGDVEGEITILEEAVGKSNGDALKMSKLRCALAYRYYVKATDPSGTDVDSLNKSTEQYKGALKLSPAMPEALNGLGLIALRSNKIDEAVKWFKQATVAKPTFADAYNNIGVAYKTRGDREQARVYYLKALQIDPANKLARENLANLDKRARP